MIDLIKRNSHPLVQQLLMVVHHLTNSLGNCCCLDTACRENPQLRETTAGLRQSWKFSIGRELPAGLLQRAWGHRTASEPSLLPLQPMDQRLETASSRTLVRWCSPRCQCGGCSVPSPGASCAIAGEWVAFGYERALAKSSEKLKNLRGEGKFQGADEHSRFWRWWTNKDKNVELTRTSPHSGCCAMTQGQPQRAPNGTNPIQIRAPCSFLWRSQGASQWTPRN